MRIRWSFLFVLLNCGWLSAQVIPFQGELSSEESKLFVELERELQTDARQAIRPAFGLVGITKTNLNKYVWSNLNYAALLLENDSVAKANSILADSTNLQLSEVQPWLQQLHAINMASSYELTGEYGAGEKLLREVLDNQPEAKLYLMALMRLAENLRFQGKLDLSRINWHESIKLATELTDSISIADSYRGRGIVFFLLDRLDDAEADFEVFEDHANKVGNTKKKALVESLFGLVEYNRGNYQSAISKALKSYELRQSIQDVKGQGESLNNLALGYMGLKNWSQALRYLEEAVQMKTLSSDLSQMTVIMNNTGHCYRGLGNSTEANRYFRLALAKGWENGQIGDVINSYNNLIKLSLDLEQFEETVNYQARLMSIKDSLAQIERVKAIDALEIQYETDKKEQEILMLQQQQTIITNRWLTLALGLFLAIVIGALILDNQRRKHRQQTELLTAEDELQKAELKIMSDLLDHNQQKLSLYTENLLKKNELVGQLESRLKTAVESVGDDGSEGEELLRNFSGVRILTDEDWEEFKNLFDGVHRGMLNRLLLKYENLTLAEQRLFLLMKLDMSTKEIANILGVSPDSVKKGRYRLKKKIRLSDAISLQEFVSQF